MDDSTQRGGSREALVVDALAVVFHLLDAAEPSPQIRALRSQARMYEQTIKHWTAVPPTYAQLDMMFDLVTELHGKATGLPKRRQP